MQGIDKLNILNKLGNFFKIDTQSKLFIYKLSNYFKYMFLFFFPKFAMFIHDL